MARVLIVSNIRVFDEAGMATGPGLRAWGIARALSVRGHQTILAEPGQGRGKQPDADREGVRLISWRRNDTEFVRSVAHADVVIVQPGTTVAAAFGGLETRCLVVDLYNPVMTEAQALTAPTPAGLEQLEWILCAYRYFLQRGDYFLCAGERQRWFTIGALAHAGRHNPLSDLNDLLHLVPMGVEATPPSASPDSPLLRGRVVPTNAELLIWPGGIYRWFEGVTAIRALHELRRNRPHATLVFVGADNPLQPAASNSGVAEARAVARELGLLGVHVHFVPWQAYDNRAAVYREADLAVVTHRPLLEAQFSWRTRSVDCLWGGLPLVGTAGDEVGEIAERAGAAVCVPPEDPIALAGALRELLADPDRRAAMSAAARTLAAETWSWERVTEPLHHICLDPRPAPDRGVMAQHLGGRLAARPTPPMTPRRVFRRVGGSIRYRLGIRIPALARR